MCTVILPPGVNPIAVKYIIYIKFLYSFLLFPFQLYAQCIVARVLLPYDPSISQISLRCDIFVSCSFDPSRFQIFLKHVVFKHLLMWDIFVAPAE